jgi:hypothetical protein
MIMKLNRKVHHKDVLKKVDTIVLLSYSRVRRLRQGSAGHVRKENFLYKIVFLLYE